MSGCELGTGEERKGQVDEVTQHLSCDIISRREGGDGRRVDHCDACCKINTCNTTHHCMEYDFSFAGRTRQTSNALGSVVIVSYFLARVKLIDCVFTIPR